MEHIFVFIAKSEAFSWVISMKVVSFHSQMLIEMKTSLEVNI